MCDVVDQAMRDGAVGVSSSLQYVPNMYNSTDELIAMAKVAARYGGAYFTHQRSEAERDRRLARRGLPHREGGRDPRADLAPEDRVQAQLGPHARDPRSASRRRAPRASTSPPTSIPGHRRLQRPRRLPAAVGPRGRPRRAPEAPGGSRAAREGRRRRCSRTPTTGRTSISAPAARIASWSPSVLNTDAQEVRGQDDRPDRRRRRRRIPATR